MTRLLPILLLGCVSRPVLDLPPEPAETCQECRDACADPKCAESECRKLVTLCNWGCGWVCSKEAE